MCTAIRISYVLEFSRVRDDLYQCTQCKRFRKTRSTIKLCSAISIRGWTPLVMSADTWIKYEKNHAWPRLSNLAMHANRFTAWHESGQLHSFIALQLIRFRVIKMFNYGKCLQVILFLHFFCADQLINKVLPFGARGSGNYDSPCI